MTPVDIKQRAARAKALLDDPLLKEAFLVVHKAQIAVFTADKCDSEQIMEAHRMVRALRLVEEHLKSVIDDGKMLDRREGVKR